MTDPIAERIRKLGGATLRSIGHIARAQRVLDNDADYVEPLDMLAELCEDNKALAARLRQVHNVCSSHRNIASASLMEIWIGRRERAVRADRRLHGSAEGGSRSARIGLARTAPFPAARG